MTVSFKKLFNSSIISQKRNISLIHTKLRAEDEEKLVDEWFRKRNKTESIQTQFETKIDKIDQIKPNKHDEPKTRYQKFEKPPVKQPQQNPQIPTRQRLQIMLKQKLSNDEQQREFRIDQRTNLFVTKASRDLHYRNKLCESIRNNEPCLVVDMARVGAYRSFDDLKNVGLQLSNVLALNRFSSRAPFQLHLCNYDYSSEFHAAFSNLFDFDRYLVFHTNKSYMDVFEKERLVYISMSGRGKLSTFDPNRVYVISAALRDHFQSKAFAQAKKDGISCQRLPIDDYSEYKSYITALI